ncbi:hypothetical protein SCWH03_18620 [Streptomyces pacificus]|uniref:Uncharacterized protein n=1 Tax=Streptomyces pacificus TaxID=2705029 RepID=A0A6A0ATF6_9ACTN|nr:hypothetical protein SCWH03_18620 [Streptomyces pacificus]
MVDDREVSLRRGECRGGAERDKARSGQKGALVLPGRLSPPEQKGMAVEEPVLAPLTPVNASWLKQIALCWRIAAR